MRTTSRLRSFAILTLVSAGLVLAAGSTAGAQTFDKRTAKRLAEVIENLQNDRFKEAMGSLDGVNTDRLKPYARATVFELYAHTYAGLENFEKSGEYFKKALESEGFEGDRQVRLRFQLAQIYMMLERWDDAIAELRVYFTTIETPAPDAYYRLAVAYYQKGDQKKAVKPAVLAIKKSKTPKESHMRLLLALYMEQKKYKNSIPLLEKLVTLYPKKAYWMQLSAVYNALGREVDALASQQLAYQQGLLTEDRELRRLTQLYLYHELPYRAGVVMEKALEEELVESDAKAWELLGNSWLTAKEYDRALPPLQKAAEISETGDLYARLGRVYIQSEEWESASGVLDKAVEKGGLDDVGNTHLLLGVSLYNEGKLGKARRQFQHALEHENSEKNAVQWIKVVDRDLE